MVARGTSNGPTTSWVVSALVVALVATAAALRLFVGAAEDWVRSEDYAVSAPAAPNGAELDAGTLAETPQSEVQESTEPAPEPIVIRITLDRSRLAARFLRDAGLEPDEAQRWGDLFRSIARTPLMARGHLASLYKDPETGSVRGFRYDLDDHTTIVAQGYANGVVLIGQRPIQYVVRPVSLAFTVRDSFDREVTRRGIPRPIVESLEDAFRSERPLSSLPQGAGLKLIYSEQVSRDGTHRAGRDLEAAQVRVGGQTMRAFAFRDEHGRAHLYDERGRPLGPQVLRFPLPFEYISSGFSTARYHPILHRYRPHVGVDLVAQYGTPVKAIADGRVQSADWAGELGNCVRLEHERGMVSIYGHLSRISPGIRSGGYVKVGQIIGRVGSTGLSTGPHLHFALLHEGRYVNPLNQKLGANHEVSPRLRGLFDQMKQRYQALLAKLPDLGSHRVLASERKPAISPFGELYHVELKHRFATHRRYSRLIPTESADANAGGL